MSTTDAPKTTSRDNQSPEPARRADKDQTQTAPAGRWLAITRIALGFTFLWAFADKTFGLGYATPGARAWVNGGSPTSGFLGNVEVGPFQSLFKAMAGSAVIDWVFMLGMLALSVALIGGVGLRIAAVAGAVLVMMMYAAEWPLDRMTSAGEPSGSNNPLVEYHLIYALVLIVLALTNAGRTWGLAKMWQSTTLVQRNPWLK